MATRAQIIATIGPVSGTREALDVLVRKQMDVVRLNFSWGTHDEHRAYIENTRAAAESARRRIPIIQDLSGPRIQGEQGHSFDPGATPVAGVLTKKDLNDLEFGISQKVDYVALSYVGQASDVEVLREKIRELGGSAKIIAKIERSEALAALDGIIEASDAIMIARGDLGQNIPIEQVPFVERDIILKCKAARKPVITATQMMFSMTENPYPTRAEVTDVAYAIVLGSDAVMLSEETARGKHPFETVEIMDRIIAEAEKHAFDFEINRL
ncbi:MAG: pyruvate kinase [bacterium]|nr:pyruvate kinase [bacterium]